MEGRSNICHESQDANSVLSQNDSLNGRCNLKSFTPNASPEMTLIFTLKFPNCVIPLIWIVFALARWSMRLRQFHFLAFVVCVKACLTYNQLLQLEAIQGRKCDVQLVRLQIDIL